MLVLAMTMAPAALMRATWKASLSETNPSSDFDPFARTIAWFGRLNSLAQTVLKITSPGVPDFYQGTEHVALTLVDPERRWTVEPATFRSRSRNTPFAGTSMRGKALGVCLAGRVVESDLGDLDGRFKS